MAGYPLGPLLRAREYREDAAARKSRQAKAAVEEAEKAVAAAGRNLERHRAWRPAEEKRLFELVRGRNISQSELDRHLSDAGVLRDDEIRLEEVLKSAEKAARAAMETLEEARRAQTAAARDRRKIEEHRSRWLQAETKRLEAAEESELEDFSGRTAVDE